MNKTKKIVIILFIIITIINYTYAIKATDQSLSTQQQSQSTATGTQQSQVASDTSASDFGETYYIPKTLKKVPGNVYQVAAHVGENGKRGGGKRGDQTGKEVNINSITDRRKYQVFRYPDSKVARTIAFYMGDVANNENVGYAQYAQQEGDGERETLEQEIRKVNYDPSALNTPCNTDCSAFVSNAIRATFAKANIPKNVPTMYTGEMQKDLLSLGFEKVQGLIGSSMDILATGRLQIGDILVTVRAGHTFVCMGEYFTSNKMPPNSSGTYGQESGSGTGYTADGEEIDERANWDKNKFRFQGLPGEITYEGETSPIRNFFKKIGDFIDLLIGMIFMIIKIVLIGFTNIAYNIFLTVVKFFK